MSDRERFAKSAPASLARGVGHPIEAVPDVGRVDAASRDIDRPAGVVFRLQVSKNSVEPCIAKRSRNLLSHDNRGPESANDSQHVGP